MEEYIISVLVLFFLLLPFYFFYKGSMVGKQRYRKFEPIYKKLTTCKKCGRRNYQIQKQIHEITYRKPVKKYIPGVSSKDIDNDPNPTLTESFYRIDCNSCGQRMFEKVFVSGTGGDKVESDYYSDFIPINDVPLKAELADELFPLTGCSQSAYYITGTFLLIVDIFAILFTWII